MTNMWRIRTIMTGVGGSPWYNNLFFAESASGSAGNVQAKVRAFWSDMSGFIAPGVSIQVDPEILTIEAETGNIVASGSQVLAPVASAGATGPGAVATQVLVRLNTGVRRNNRNVIGHMFIPFPCKGDITTDGQYAAGRAANVATNANALVAFTTGGVSYRMGVWSRPKTFLGVSTPGAFSLVSTASVPTKLSFLSSRRD